MRLSTLFEEDYPVSLLSTFVKVPKTSFGDGWISLVIVGYLWSLLVIFGHTWFLFNLKIEPFRYLQRCYTRFWALLQKCMGSGYSIHVEPYLDDDTASLSSDESIESIDSMDTANMSDESDSDNESLFI